MWSPAHGPIVTYEHLIREVTSIFAAYSDFFLHLFTVLFHQDCSLTFRMHGMMQGFPVRTVLFPSYLYRIIAKMLL